MAKLKKGQKAFVAYGHYAHGGKDVKVIKEHGNGVVEVMPTQSFFVTREYLIPVEDKDNA